MPRINIGIFCDNQSTLQAMQQAAADRRMARAHVTIQSGGIIGAFQAYSDALSPNLLIVESNSTRDDDADRAQPARPGLRCTDQGHRHRPCQRRHPLPRADAPGRQRVFRGADQSAADDRSRLGLYTDPKAKPIGRIIAFVGAKGGVGSSTIAHNVGWLISRDYNTDTVITDLDLAFGTAGLNFNQEARRASPMR